MHYFSPNDAFCQCKMRHPTDCANTFGLDGLAKRHGHKMIKIIGVNYAFKINFHNGNYSHLVYFAPERNSLHRSWGWNYSNRNSNRAYLSGPYRDIGLSLVSYKKAAIKIKE